MIKQARKDYVPHDLEKQVQDFWRRTQAYEKTRKLRAGGEDFYFVDGPPYTTGSIHLGTALNKTIKDAIVRWRRMQGLNVRDQPGYDMHGLPIEVQVERSLGITNKQQIEDFGIEKFVTTCRQFSLDLLAKMTEQFRSIGVWMDWDNPYMTTKTEFIEAEWWALKRAHEKGLLMRDVRSLQWCTRCETALAEAEIEYSDETDPSIYVRFALKDRANESLVIWTTTPWTLPANLAVSVHPEFTYARVDLGTGAFLWLLEDTVPQVLAAAGLAGQVVERKKGAELVGWPYVHPLVDKVPYHASVPAPKAHTVVASSVVTAEQTGLVHTAPGHGPEDFDVGKANGLPPFSPVDERGLYTAEAGAYAGKHVREANDIILKDLEDAHALLHRDKIVHRYGHCWRCRTPIVFRVTEQWFLRVAPIKEKMLSEIKRIQWTPDWAGSARQWEWTQNLRDWCISRQRYWGTPVPLWVCEKCGDLRVIGSADDLRVGQNYKEGMDLHRPWIDGVTFRCTKCGSLQRRVRDVLDVWFDSAVSSWAQLGYPRDKAQFQRWWPVDWIVEGNDQTRGWFNSQMFAGVIAFDRAPYESVVLHGWVNGPDGRQMHRHLGNYIEPFEVVEKHGVDAFRLYLLRSNAPWEDITFSWEDVKNAGRTLNILFNVFKFATMYMAMDRFEPEANTVDNLVKHMTPEDKWLLSRVERVKGTVTAHLERYELHRAARALEEFVVEDLSRWYVKLIRDRTWREGEDRGKLAAEAVLYEALVTAAKLIAPICPHLSEEIYQSLDGRLLTVHMSDWPKPREDFLNANLENAMNTVRDLVDVVAKVRQKENVKLRWPIRTVTLRGPTREAVAALGQLKHVFLDLANAKALEVVPADSAYADLELALVPDPKAIGKMYKAWWSKIATILEMRSAAEVQRDLDEKGEYRIGIEGQMIKILPNMVTVEHRLPKAVIRAETPYGELFVDLRVTEEIRAEGMAREVVRRVQQMRKDLDLDVEDYVRTSVKASEELVGILGPLRDYVARESRSRTLTLGTSDVDEEYVVEWPNVDGATLLVGVTPLHAREAIQAFTSIGLSDQKAFLLFDSGYKTLASVKSASRAELLAIEGLEETDVKRITDSVEPQDRGGAPCAVCGAPSKPGVSRCWRCGELPPGILPCPSCREPIPRGTYVCPHCGFGTEKAKAPPPTPTPEPVAAPIPEPASVTVLAEMVEPAPPPAPVPAATTRVRVELTRPDQLPAPMIEAQASSTYLVKESMPGQTYAIFLDTLRRGRKGFCVTRVYPQKIREKYGIGQEVPVLWLSNVGKEDSVRPKDLEKLSLALEQFIAKEAGVVLMDGIEYLVTNNNFLTVLRLVQALRDTVAINGATLVISVNPSTLDTHQMTLLEKEVDGVVTVG